MKVDTINSPKVAFKGSFYNNKTLLNGLKYASENAALVATGTTLFFSTIVRPVAILLTPDADKKDKHYACAKSILSGVLGAALTAAIFTPLSKAVNSITEAPEEYLKQATIKNLKQSAKTIDESYSYNFIRQILKLSPEVLSIVPKAILTTALIVPLATLLFRNKDNNKQKKIKHTPTVQKAYVPSFQGGGAVNLTKKIAKIFDSETMQRIANKYKDSNFIQHSLNLKDILATVCFAAATLLNPKIKKENKSALIYNTSISTGLTIGGGYAVNKLLDKPFKKFTEKFIAANKDDKNLYKYLNGVKIVKPIAILSLIYYVFIPMVSTFWADKIVKKTSAKIDAGKQ